MGELAFCQLSRKGAKIRDAVYKCIHYLQDLASYVDAVLVTPTSEFLSDATGSGEKRFKKEFAEKLRGIFKVPIIGIPHPSRGKTFPDPSDEEKWKEITVKIRSVIEEGGIRFINTSV